MEILTEKDVLARKIYKPQGAYKFPETICHNTAPLLIQLYLSTQTEEIDQDPDLQVSYISQQVREIPTKSVCIQPFWFDN